MWNHQRTHLEHDDAQKVTVCQGTTRMTYADVLDGWATNAGFRIYFLQVLEQLTTNPFRWETPPVTTGTLEQPFEFVVLDSPELARPADRQTFADLFAQLQPGGIGEFPNLGGDALMIVPAPADAASAYAHLGAFLREAPEAQRQALLTLVGASVLRNVGEQPALAQYRRRRCVLGARAPGQSSEILRLRALS